MGSKTGLTPLKNRRDLKDESKVTDSFKNLAGSKESKIDIDISSDEDSVDSSNTAGDASDSEENVAADVGEEDEYLSEDDGSGEEEIEQLDDNMSDSDDDDDGKENDNERTMNSDGVDFSDSDNDLEAAEESQDGENMDSHDIKVAANPAWAQAMAKILRTQKPSGKKAVVLSKARTIQAAEAAAGQKSEQPDFEIIGEKEVKPRIKTEDETKPSAEDLLLAKRGRLSQCRVKQDDFDYNRERALTKIATKGVVQLFNAVRSQQKNLGSKMAEAHSTRMEEKLLKSIDKDSFLEHLTGKIRSRPVEELAKTIKKERGETIVLPKSWDELSKTVEAGTNTLGWDTVIEIKDEPDD